MKNARLIIFLLHLVLGLYFINTGFHFVTIPEVVSKVDAWIILIGGVLVLLGGINYMRIGRWKNLPR